MISFLNDTGKCEMLKDKFDKKIKFDNNNNKDENIEDQWQNIKNSIHNIMEKILGYRRRVSKKKCMTPEILNMMKKRRHVKKIPNTSEYISQEKEKIHG